MGEGAVQRVNFVLRKWVDFKAVTAGEVCWLAAGRKAGICFACLL